MCSDERVRVAVEVVDDPTRAEVVARDAAVAAALADLDLGRNLTQASTIRRWRAPRGRSVCSVALGRVQEVRDDLDREDARHASLLVHHRPVLGVRLEQVRERVAQDVVDLDQRLRHRVGHGGHRLLGQVALGHPSQRPALVVHHERVRQVRLGDPRAHGRRRLAHVCERRLPEVDVSHADQRQALQRTVRAHEVLDEVVRGAHQQLRRRRVLCQHPALLHHGHPVAHLDRLVDVVGDEQDRLADLRLEPQELVLEALPVDRVDGAEGLVHQHQRRVRGERARHADPLPLAAGQLRGKAVAHVRGQGDEVEHLLHAAGDARAVPPEQARHHADVVPDREVGEEADLLDHVPDATAQLGRRARADADTVDQDVAVAQLDHAVHEPQGGRLAAARRTDEHADLTGGHGQREVVERGVGLAAVALGRVPELDRRGGRGGSRGAVP